MEGDGAKLPLFHGNGTQDPEQYWLRCEVVWTVRKNVDDEFKKVQLATTIWGRALDWFMKFAQFLTVTPMKTLAEVRK